MATLIVIGLGVFILLAILGVFITKYRTVGPDEALIVSGSYLGRKNVHTDASGNKVKIIRGGGTFVIPVFQQAQPLSLLSSKLEVKTSDEVYTASGVPVLVDGTAITKIGGTIEQIATAAEQFLGKTKEVRENEVREVLEGHLRGILGGMEVEAIYKNRQEFSSRVMEIAEQDLDKMGLTVVSFTIKDVKDKNGYLESLGKPRIAQVKRDADIATAVADKETRIQQAEASKEAKRAELERATEIAEAEKLNQLKIAEFKKEQDTAKARADQAYELEAARAKQEVTEQEMQVQIIERQKQIELEEKEIARREKQYDAEVKKKADADRYAIEQNAEALKMQQMAQADAEKYQIEAKAKADAEQVRVEGLAKADAEKAIGLAAAEVVRVDGLAKAEADKAQGTVAADIILAKGLAEAQAKEKIAQAFEMFGQAAVLDMVVRMMPEYAKEVAAPLGNIDKITVVDTGSGKNGGAGKVTGYATDLMAGLQESLKASSGIDMKQLLENFTTRK